MAEIPDRSDHLVTLDTLLICKTGDLPVKTFGDSLGPE